MPDTIVARSRFSFAQTVETLTASIAAGGATLFAAIDQRAAAEAAGVTLRPTTLLVFGNPRAGTALMDAFPLVALELPLKLLIWEADGTVCVAAVPASVAAAHFGVDGHDELLATLDAGLERLVASIR